jgi:hypothetical protein
MSNWRKGIKTVPNLRTGGTYNVSQTTMYEALFAVNMNKRRRNPMGKGAYPFAEKEKLYQGYSQAQLWYARRDAQKSMENAANSARAYERQYGANSGAAVEWRANEAYYADDLHTLLKIINQRQNPTHRVRRSNRRRRDWTVGTTGRGYGLIARSASTGAAVKGTAAEFRNKRWRERHGLPAYVGELANEIRKGRRTRAKYLYNPVDPAHQIRVLQAQLARSSDRQEQRILQSRIQALQSQSQLFG